MTPKPCPFHTTESCNLKPCAVGYAFAVRCDTCGAEGPSALTKELAIEMWNTRAGSEYQAEIDKLKEELKQLRDKSS